MTKAQMTKEAKKLLASELTSASKVIKAINQNRDKQEIKQLYNAYGIGEQLEFSPVHLLKSENGIFCKLVRLTEKTSKTKQDAAVQVAKFLKKDKDGFNVCTTYLFIPVENTINDFFASVNSKIMYDKKMNH